VTRCCFITRTQIRRRSWDSRESPALPTPTPRPSIRKSPYFDAKSKREEPRWILVDVAFVEKLATPVPLDRLREDPALNGMLVAQKGQRLSVQPVLRAHFEHVARIAGATRLAELLG
jgi:predicted RNA-binding protein with PUA-like domain